MTRLDVYQYAIQPIYQQHSVKVNKEQSYKAHHVYNLQLIPWTNNVSKFIFSAITTMIFIVRHHVL